jgi:HSP20 family protein
VPVKINAAEEESFLDRARNVYQAVAQRAYELFDGRGRQHGHDLDDWLRAERELQLHVPVEVIEYADHLSVSAEVPGLSEKEIKVNLDPRRLTIGGKREQSTEEKTRETIYTSRRSKEVFHQLNLPTEVDPSKATATLKYGVLEIKLPKAVASEPTRLEVKIK